MNDKINQTSVRLNQFLVVIATAVVVFVNYLGGIGRINNKAPDVVSDKYPTLLTPADYAFGIWSLIYIGLIIFTVYQALPAQKENPRFRKIRSLYLINCAANCAWIYLWSYEMIWASLAVIFVMLGTLVLINSNLQNKNDPAETWTTRVPFGLYFGWVTVATVLNFTVALVYSGVKTSDSITRILAVILVGAIVIAGVVVRLKLSTAAYALAIAWALTAIAIKHNTETMLIISTAFGVIALLIAAIFPLTQATQTQKSP